MVAIAHVLIVDDDPGTLLSFSALLRTAGWSVRTASCGEDALRLAESHRIDLLIADLSLPGISGIDVIRGVRKFHTAVRCLIVTGFASVESVVEALRCGAADYLEKPVFADELLNAAHRAITLNRQVDGLVEAAESNAHAASRLAHAIIRVIDSRSDPKTLNSWSRCCTVSLGTLRNWCYMAGVSPKRCLDFARVLRATVRQEHGSRLENLFDVVDRRTLHTLLKLGAAEGGQRATLPINVDSFFESQRWISSPTILQELKVALSEHCARIVSGAMSPPED